MTQELRASESDLLIAARAGDNHAFERLIQPRYGELHVHCYRMLGSLDDADDALQESLLRTWRQIDKYEPIAPFRAWLYRVTTNVCLTQLAKRSRRAEAPLLVESAFNDSEDDAVRLDPYPEHFLDELWPAQPGPEVAIERAESVELAFVASVQLLPAKQRATLLLRDVLNYSAAEVAGMLSITVPGVNSALQRAQATLERERSTGRVTREHVATNPAAEQALVKRLITAWHAADIPGIVSLLSEDALVTMPPESLRISGRTAIGEFLSTVPGGGRLDRFRLFPMRANRQPALAAYFRDADHGSYHAHAVIVLAINGAEIASIVRFAEPDLFARFGLPTSISDELPRTPF